MKTNILKLSAVIVTAMILFACNKVKDLPFYNNGKAVDLSSSATTLSPAPADSLKEVVNFSWTNPAYASDSGTFKYVLQIDSSGRNFSKKAEKEIIGTLSASLTGKELNVILLNFGFAPGSTYKLDVRVLSSYNNNNEQYSSNTVSITVAPYGDSSTLTSSVTSAKCELNTASQNAVDFSWTSSFNGYPGIVTYTIQYDSVGKQFAHPAEITAGNGVFTKSLTQGELNETALNSGVEGGKKGTIEYRVKASTSFGATVYSNVVAIAIETYFPLVRFYMPGSYQVEREYGLKDWDPTTAPEFVRDLRPTVLNELYYIYIYLPANTEFKITQGRSWDINYGGSAGMLSATGGNLKVSAAGFYRISIDRKTLKYDIREGRMGFVGGATGAAWDPPSVFPNYAMGTPATNLFVGITDMKADAWKLIDNNTWNDGSNTVSETRSYGATGGSGTTMVVNGDNFPSITTAGRYRAIWDGRNVDNIQYDLSSASEMRVVGDGLQGVAAWDPSSSPQMTYMGKGVWQIKVALIGGKDIKFVAGNAWGAFDYEDNSGQSTATGVLKKIKWEGGDNFKTPTTSGTYTIILDEYNQTVTINL